MKFIRGENPSVRFKEVPHNTPFTVLEVCGREGPIKMKINGNLRGKPFEGLLDLQDGYVTSLDTHSQNCFCVVYKNAELVLKL